MLDSIHPILRQIGGPGSTCIKRGVAKTTGFTKGSVGMGGGISRGKGGISQGEGGISQGKGEISQGEGERSQGKGAEVELREG